MKLSFMSILLDIDSLNPLTWENKMTTKIKPDMESRIISAMSNTWQVIGSDCFQAQIDCGEESRDMKRAEVMEVVADANYMEMYGNDKEAVSEFRKLDYKDQNVILKKAFPYTRYGR